VGFFHLDQINYREKIMTTIDAHHHLWHFTPEEFGWLEGPLAPLRRDYLEPDLFAAIATANIDGVVTVQARQSLEETRWLLEIAARNPQIRGVVGWAPIASPNFAKSMDEFAANPKLKALRHVIQAEPDPNFILREDFNHGIRQLQGTGLAYDILIFERHLPQTIEFVDRHPNQTFVLDHIAKPRIAAHELEPWATNLRALALRPNVTCKLSGMVTEADPLAWTPAQLTPYLETAVAAFTPARLMAGSDWPVSLAGVQYAQWFELLRTFFHPFSAEERSAIFGQNAIATYHLEP
jgi:L-fuconolactonase